MFKNKHVLSAIMINTRLEFLPLVVLCVKHLGKTCLPGLDTALFWGSCLVTLVVRFIALLGWVTLLRLTIHSIDSNKHQERALIPVTRTHFTVRLAISVSALTYRWKLSSVLLCFRDTTLLKLLRA